MSKKQLERNKQGGFTIIEVVLVLAIAGLIFLIVFLALPQLQRSRRDTQRKNDAGRVLAALENESGNNNGEYPDVAADEFEDFMDDYFEWTATESDLPGLNDPSEDFYNPVIGELEDVEVPDLSYVDGDCEGNNGGGRTRSIVIALEQGGEYCQDNR